MENSVVNDITSEFGWKFSHLNASFVVLERLSFERTGMWFCLVFRKSVQVSGTEKHVAQEQAFSCLVASSEDGKCY